MTDGAQEAKQRLRSELRAVRTAIPTQARAEAAKHLAAHLPRHPLVEPLEPGYVLVPIGHRSEISTHALAQRLEGLGWTLVRPRSDPARSHLDAVPWPLDAPLSAGFAGIPEPPLEAPTCAAERLRLILVPGLGFARDGHRIGSGLGFFDRFLAPLLAHPSRPVTIGIGYAAQLLDHVPHEAHDIPLDGLQLEDQSLVCR